MSGARPFRPCIVIPIYNNKDTIGSVVNRLVPCGIPILVVNDGSDKATHEVLVKLEGTVSGLRVAHLPVNQGKGAAVREGLYLAEQLGYSHCVQVDADGQHHLEDVPLFLDTAREHPDALVLGKPIFGDDVPKARLYGRELSKFFVRLEILSGAIGDPLFGFRVYPVAASAQLFRDVNLGLRMDFDPEIAVRLVWRGLPVINIDTRVYYPEGGLSHFNMIRDNLRMTWLHTRLCLGMILRLPFLMAGKFRR